jgi:predicted DNA-binding protein YlxM (UPF0122 family)
MARNPASKPNPAKIADEQVKVLNLRRDGLSVREIAERTGIAKSTVQDRLDAALAELVLPLADDVRQLELLRLDTWQKRLEERLTDAEDPVRVVPVALAVQARRAKLLGLDAPTKVDAHVDHISLPPADPAVEQLLAAAREAAL